MPAGPVTGCWAAGVWADTVWEVGVWADVAALLDFVLDKNTRLMAYLRDFYTVSAGDLTTLSTRYLREECTGEYTARFRQLEHDATDAMT